jgi:predicted nuclease of restriction endonuclease-like (RecB) superfamily
MAAKKDLKVIPPRLPAGSPSGGLPGGYHEFLEDIKTRVREAQVRASLAAHRELIDLYWYVGKSIVERQQAEGWGQSIVERFSRDMQTAFPGIEGFSRQNIWKMRGFYLAYTEGVSNLSQPVREIPWGHNIELLSKIKDPIERLWYAKIAVENGWSRAVLVHQIETGLFERQGKAVTNFKRTLPPPQSDLAQQALKDPYTFDFLTLAGDAHERELEQGLLDHIQKFLLELGVGFAFVGRQVHLEVEGDDFHLSAVDDRLRHKDDHPSIGMILCKSRKKMIVEYALRDTHKPIGVSAYKLTKALPKEMRGTLPTIQELESELESEK